MSTTLQAPVKACRSKSPVETQDAPARDGHFSFHEAAFDYEPYPIGLATSVLPADWYNELCDTWPDTDLFEYKPNLGHKFSLSIMNRPDVYHQFVRTHAAWKELYHEINSRTFVERVLNVLIENNIDTGLQHRRICDVNALSSPWKKLRKRVSRRRKTPPLNVRFEYSMLPADGGHIRPHTDAPAKYITLVLSMVREGEWQPEWGGGTEVHKVKDITRNYNHMNHYMEFDEVDTLKAFEFRPNQCVIFVRTFNSLHSVRPMTGPGTGALRKSLTINIESEYYW